MCIEHAGKRGGGSSVLCTACRDRDCLEVTDTPHQHRIALRGFRIETLVTYEFNLNQNFYTFTSIIPTKFVMCSEFL